MAGVVRRTPTKRPQMSTSQGREQRALRQPLLVRAAGACCGGVSQRPASQCPLALLKDPCCLLTAPGEQTCWRPWRSRRGPAAPVRSDEVWFIQEDLTSIPIKGRKQSGGVQQRALRNLVPATNSREREHIPGARA